MDTQLIKQVETLKLFADGKKTLSAVQLHFSLEKIAQYARECSGETLKKVQEAIIQSAIAASVVESGGKHMLKTIVRMVEAVYTHGDQNKIQAQLFSPLINQIQALNDKKNQEERNGKLYISSRVFLDLSRQRHLGLMAASPAKDLIDAYFKVYSSKNADQSTKLECQKGITRVIKAGSQSTHQLVPDLIKMQTKTIEKITASTHIDTIQVAEILKGLAALVKETFSQQVLATNFEMLHMFCLKGFQQVDVIESKKAFSHLFAEIFNLRLDETLRSGNLITSFNQHLESQGIDLKAKKKNQVVVEMPRTLGEVVSYFSALMFKNQLDLNFALGLSESLLLIISGNPLHFEALDLQHCLNSQLLYLQLPPTPTVVKGKDKTQVDTQMKTKHQAMQHMMIRFFDQLIGLMNRDQKTKLTDFLRQTLEQKQLIMSRETVSQFSPIFNNQKELLKVSSMFNSPLQQELCLYLYGKMFTTLSETQINSLFQNETQVVQPILKYLHIKDDKIKQSVQQEAKKVVQVIAKELTQLHWIQNLLFKFFQLTTFENADLQTFSQNDKVQFEQIDQKQLNLNTLAQCTSYFLQEIRSKTKEKAMPLALAESAMKTVKGLVLGDLQKSLQEERDKGIFTYNNKIIELQAQPIVQMSRFEAGWILLLGLLQLGEDWLCQNVEQVLMLLYSVFSKDMCSTKGFTNVPQILKEFDLKVKALEVLKHLVLHHKQLLLEVNQLNIKLISQFLNNACNFLFSNSKDKEVQEMIAVFQKASPRQYKEAKLHFVECILALETPQNFQSNMINILHMLCENVVAARKVNDLRGLFSDIVQSWDFVEASSEQTPSASDQCAKESVKLMADLFLMNQALTQKNQLQLIRHFESYSNVDLEKEQVNPGRMQKIGLFCLLLAKKSALLPSNEYERVSIDNQVVEKIVCIRNLLLNHQDKVPGLPMLLAEMTLYLKLKEIRSTPSLLLQLLTPSSDKQPEFQVETKSHLIALTYQLFDFDTFLKPIHLQLFQYLGQSITSKPTQKQSECILFCLYSIVTALDEDEQTKVRDECYGLALQLLHTCSNSESSQMKVWLGKLSLETKKIEMSQQQYRWNQTKQGEQRDYLNRIMLKETVTQDASIWYQAFKETELRTKPHLIKSIAKSVLHNASSKDTLKSLSQLLLKMLNLQSYKIKTDIISSLTWRLSNSKVIELLTIDDVETLEVSEQGVTQMIVDTLSFCLKLEEKQCATKNQVYNHILNLYKQIHEFKFESTYSEFQQNPQKFISATSKAEFQLFDSDVHEQVKEQVSYYLLSYFESIDTVEAQEYQFVKPMLHNLITLGCKLAQTELLTAKRIGVQMLSQIIRMFRKSVEKIGDEDSDEENTATKNSGPLLLEIYEAQIQSVIRTCLQDQLQSFLYSNELLYLTEQFLSWGICNDDSVKQKTTEQLMTILISKEQQKFKKELLDYQELTQLYPEMICANSYVQRLQLINKISNKVLPELQDPYIKIMKDFLIIVCAQAQDANNPNCIKDIKSLKILYPSKTNCAINMYSFIRCIISVISLPGTVDAEFTKLRNQIFVVLLSSSPESLLISDVAEVVSLRVQTVDSMSKCKEFWGQCDLMGTMYLLKVNFDLNVLQLSHAIIKAFVQLLGAYTQLDFQLVTNVIYEKTLLFSKHGKLDAESILTIKNCHLAILQHLSDSDEYQRTIKDAISQASVKEPIQNLVNKLKANAKQKEVNRLVQSILSTLQHKPQLGDSMLSQLASSFEGMDTQAVRTLSMLVFYSIYKTKSAESAEILTSILNNVKNETNQVAYLTTVFKLWSKELNQSSEQGSQVILLLSLKVMYEHPNLIQQVFQPVLEFMIKYYLALCQTKQPQIKRPEVCALLISCLFTAMQISPGLSMEQKNACAQSIVKIVNIDIETFKIVAQQGEQANTVAYLSQQEKAVIQNLMMKLKS